MSKGRRVLNFEEAVNTEAVILTEGAVVERLRRQPEVELDPLIANTSLVYDPVGKGFMADIYRGYADISHRFDLSMILLTPTWRANPTRLSRVGFEDIRRVNEDCVRFLLDIRGDYGDHAEKLFIGGLIGCKGDAYRPEEALPTDEAAVFHETQVEALDAAGVDFLIAQSLPALCEATGVAKAMAGCGVPYVLSFVLRSPGVMLDGTPLRRAMMLIDGNVERVPLFYMANCVHPTVLEEALSATETGGGSVRGRLLGLQANTSSKPPEELDGLAELDAEEPVPFADSMVRLYHRFDVRILGGCCGTDNRHIQCIAERVTSPSS
jgi:homocysteine S-methyltransferase